MQVGAVLVFDAGPLELRHGGIDIERVRAYTAARLSASERSAPLVDDPFFSLDYHVRHAALPRPGDERQLKRLAARIFSQSLDREKPLWELCFVEGLEDARFALIAKLDAALAGGPDGCDPLAALVSETSSESVEAAPRAETRPTPGRLAGMRAELVRRARELTGPDALGATLGFG
ncbi:MAG: wax ester/triacylglycerol synthase domain-containing protein, partial [bacterium]